MLKHSSVESTGAPLTTSKPTPLGVAGGVPELRPRPRASINDHCDEHLSIRRREWSSSWRDLPDGSSVPPVSLLGSSNTNGLVRTSHRG